MNRKRLEEAVFAARIRRKGTLLSDEGLTDVCEALLELYDSGFIWLPATADDLRAAGWSGTPRGPELDEVIRNGGRD